MPPALILGRALTVMKVAIVVMLRNIKKIDFFMPMGCESLKLPAHRVLFDLNTVARLIIETEAIAGSDD